MSQKSPRSEILMSSRRRSGSLGDEIDEPPSSPPPPPPTDQEPPNFPPVYKTDSLTRSNKVGSKVSRIKEMFQTANGAEESKFQPIKIYQHQVARSPPPALLPKSFQTAHPRPGHTGSVGSISREPTSPPTTHPGKVSSGYIAPTNHVQRFNYTRALFARMEEESKKQQEHEKIVQKPSPHGIKSPVTSPDRNSTGSPERKRNRLNTDEVIPHGRSYSESKEAEPVPRVPRRSRADNRPAIPSAKPDMRTAFSEPNIPKAVRSNLSNTPAGLLWKRKQNDIFADISNSEKYHESKARNGQSASSFQLETEGSGETLNNSVFSASNSSLAEDMSITSAYHSKKTNFPLENSNFSQGRSASHEVLNVRSPSEQQQRSRSSDDSVQGHSDDGDGSAEDRPADKGGVVLRYKKPDKLGVVGKRLSKEEIQAAIDRADTYLKKTSTSSEEGEAKRDSLENQDMVVSDITDHASTNKEVVHEKMTKSDSSALSAENDGSQLRSWARYRNQRYSRTSDYLDDKVSDVTKLGSISDTSVSGYRKASMENLSKPQTDTVNKPADPFAAISQSSVVTRRQQLGPAPKPPIPRPGIHSNIATNSQPANQHSIQSNAEEKVVENKTESEPVREEISAFVETSLHSISSSSGTAINARPIPVPRRSAPPPPPLKQCSPPPTHASANHEQIRQKSPPPYPTPSPPSEPPPPAPVPGINEDSDQPAVSLVSTIEAALSPVQMRGTARFLQLEEPEESDDLDPQKLDRAGSRKAVLIENATELPQREDGDGTEHPEVGSEPDRSSGEQTGEEEEEEEEEVNHGWTSGLSSTSSDSDDDYEDYTFKQKDRKIKFSRDPIKVFMTYSTEDYDRRNEDVDPVAASAEYELEKRVERMDVFPVDLIKGPEGLGLSIIGMGVGADAGLEKLGIFIKTLTEGGAAQKCGKMQVNDQIIEVDGKSLVGVTQAYAASVLRNTSGDVKFLIGREKDPSKSEVARLIQQSLEIDRRREEQRRQEQERLRELQDQLKPRDEVLEHEHHRHMSEGSEHDRHVSEGPSHHEQEAVDLDESSIEDEMDEEPEQEMSEELLAGEATPMSMPSGIDTEESVSSPEEGSKPVVEVFDLQESSGEDFSPDMEAQALFVKLKEAQCKNAVLEAELTKLKARLIVLESAESQQKQTEKKCEEMAQRLRDTERSLNNARKEINHYQDMMEGSQGQYIALEKKMKGEFTALEKKYHKAKKLIKEYQQREKDFIAERESLLQQQTEKDQQYNALVKSLKDRIFQLEGELRATQAAAGLPVSPQAAEATTSHRSAEVITAVKAPTVQAITPVHDSGSPLVSPIDKDSVSSESDISSAEPVSPVHEGEIKLESAGTFESVAAEGLLDTSINRAKAQVANASRRPPSKLRPKSQDSVELMESAENKQDESGLETWIKHDRTAEYILNWNVDNTVKKSDVKKRKAQQQGVEASKGPHPVSEAPPTVLATTPPITEAPPPVEEEPLPPPPPPPSGPPPSLPESDTSEASRERMHSESEETSSTVSQTSYDPVQPNFQNKESEIPGLDTPSLDTTGTSGTADAAESTEQTQKKSKGLLPKLPFKFGGSGERDKGGVMLISSRSLNSEDAGSMEGITLVSRKKLDTCIDFDGASTISDSSSGYMVGEAESTSYSFSGTPANEDNPSQPGHHSHHQFQSCPITDWTQENINYWLMAIEMEKYAGLFSDKSITGPQLVAMDSNKLKVLGISNSKDRDIMKKKIKELKIVLEKERKQQEKEKKQMDKEKKAKEKEQKKMLRKK